ncbi:hypothetical protein [uncultured Sphaerochaeta sp.]|uniref:hypothetical protein n=1 Tax=uncultured Sphaerochaeta sp. TaxID=886478 RepID=UPI002A0A6295|nr:hypothetical protein [uncultured Sphaerochaeta sp.]
MGSKKSNRLLLGTMILVILAGSVGCELSDAALQSSEGAGRSVSSQLTTTSKSTSQKTFTATVNLYQDYLNVVTLDMGNSNHHKTIEETLYSYQYGPYGGPVVSDWDLLNGKNVVMTNVTNYNLDPETGEISGSNHSVINIVDENGEVLLCLDANGNLKGDLFGAEINMNWVSQKSKDVDVKANGKVTGTFAWMGFDYENMETIQILPNGTFTLTGTYK